MSKSTGWRAGLTTDGADFVYAVVEIAFDQTTAERAWRENVPDGLTSRSGTPDEDGVYGSLEDVDFDAQAVIVWSSGQSGSCPGWLSDIRTDQDRLVHVTTDQVGSTCTDDYNPYRMMLAVDRDLLPQPEWLPAEQVAVDGRAPNSGAPTRIEAYPPSE